jgi:putative addiction module CopG family antidote
MNQKPHGGELNRLSRYKTVGVLGEYPEFGDLLQGYSRVIRLLMANIANVCYEEIPVGAAAMNVSLTTALEAFVRRKVASGLYNNASEVIREALRLMVTRETNGQSAPTKSEVLATLKALEPELKQRGVASAAIFGSVVRGQAQSDSDVDVLIDIDPAAPFDLLDLVGVKNLLADRLGRPVDVIEREALNPRLRAGILAEAEPVF